MSRKPLGTDVYQAALNRLIELYEDGHRLVLSFSAGKDSGACLGLMLEAAAITNRLPVDVVMRDEEIMFPGTFEYADRVRQRDDVNMQWLTARQPVLNVFNRDMPYFWVFDPEVPEADWVRPMPDYCIQHPYQDIQHMATAENFPPAAGKTVFNVIGLRVSESRGRLFGIHSSGGHLTKPNKLGTRLCRPIYDWSDGDVWKAHQEHGWDYNSAYTTMYRMGVPRNQLRIAPPTMSVVGLDQLKMASQAWPQWFDRVCQRCPGVRTAAQFGRRSCLPQREPGETWQDTFRREVIGEGNPQWIRERGVKVMDSILSAHKAHSTQPLPDVAACPNCGGVIGSWKNLATYLYLGDPFAMKAHWIIRPIDSEYFRPGSGVWEGSPAFA